MKKFKKYYTVGENVFIKETGQVGKVEELIIEPKTHDTEGTYVAKVSVGDEVKEYKLWEITKTNESKKAKSVEKNVVYFGKTHPQAKIPSKNGEDGCYDVYSCFDLEEFVIGARSYKMVPTGICSAFSEKYRFNCARERGSTGTIGLQVLSGQIDSGYRGEWFIVLYNANDVPLAISKHVEKTVVTEDYILYPYSKGICQAALEEVPVVKVVEMSEEQIKNFASVRGEGKIGSSGK